MTGTKIPYEQAEKVVFEINAQNPPIDWNEQARVALGVTESYTPDLDEPQDYYAVWHNSGFCQNCKNVQDSMTGYPGSWVQMMRNEFKAYQTSHQPASQYGLPEGMTWYFV